MTVAKVVDLQSRPAQAADLVLAADGIVGEAIAQLGDTVARFDFDGMSAEFGRKTPNMPARLLFDSQEIRTYPDVGHSAVLSLRSETLRAALDKAIWGRESAYLSKYEFAAAIVAQRQRWYSSASADSKPRRLMELAAMSADRNQLLQDAYQIDHVEVVRASTSDLTGGTATRGVSEADSSYTGRTDSSAVQRSHSDQHDDQRTNPVSPPLATGPNSPAAYSAPPWPETITDDATVQESAGSTGFDNTSNIGEVTTVATGSSKEFQRITNRDYNYRVPAIESDAQNSRAQASLIDEQFEQFMFEQTLPHLQTIFDNELAMIDLDIKALQYAYLSSILLSPIDGVLTGLYKTPGERARAGEVVARVENDATVLLAGTVVLRQMISVRDTVTVDTHLFGDSGNAVTIAGSVVAASGHPSEESWWNVVAACSNRDGNGDPIIPGHYRFGFDVTTLTVT